MGSSQRPLPDNTQHSQQTVPWQDLNPQSQQGWLKTYVLDCVATGTAHLLNMQGINDARQTDILTTEPLVSEPSAFEVEVGY
jgi:hypothetical protein